jgi:thiol-disulfide isomerase/thioredoxin
MSRQPQSRQPTRSRPAAGPQAQAPSRRPPNTRRAQEAARRASKRRRRWIGYGVAGLVLAVVVALVAVSVTGTRRGSSTATIGAVAPDGSFTTLGGGTETVASLRGQPVLLWFVTTWCSSCQAGTPAVAASLPKLAASHVRVVEVENYQDLGQSGPSIGQFAKVLAGSEYNNPDWTFGTASRGLFDAYNPKGYLDIYYLIDSSGKIVYVNSSPGSTMNQLLDEVSTLGASASSGGQYNGLNSTAFGYNFSRLLQFLGAPGGALQNDPPTGMLPPGWPTW